MFHFLTQKVKPVTREMFAAMRRFLSEFLRYEEPDPEGEMLSANLDLDSQLQAEENQLFGVFWWSKAIFNATLILCLLYLLVFFPELMGLVPESP